MDGPFILPMRATRNIHKIEEALLLWTPESWSETFHSSLESATYGKRWYLAPKYFLRRDACHVCGSQSDALFDFIMLIPILDEEKEGIKYICTDHGPDIVRNCFTNEKVNIPPPLFPLLRQARNIFQWIILKGYILIRFIWYFLGDAFFYRLGGYKIAAWWFFLRGLKR